VGIDLPMENLTMHAQAQTDIVANDPTPLPMRSHTIFGVCEALGEDFGFNPTWIRVPFAASVLVSPTYAILAYFALGVVVLASRMIFPKSKAGKTAPDVEAQAVAANSQADERLAA
jgi:phage shock protein PspC (stress-responsive transcriptional regulator)